MKINAFFISNFEMKLIQTVATFIFVAVYELRHVSK